VTSASYSAFQGHRRLAQGDLATVLAALKDRAAGDASILILDDRNGERIEPDRRDDLAATLARFAEPAQDGEVAPSGPPTRGRPRLGVTAKEVTLLPRHWDWLQTQPGGASATLRRLVETARREGAQIDQARRSQRALDRFLYLVAGDLPDFEEVYRAFYAGDAERFIALTQPWPIDVRDHARALLTAVAS
jgi:hypothetical protein